MATFDDLRIREWRVSPRLVKKPVYRQPSMPEVASLLAQSEEGREAMLAALVEAGVLRRELRSIRQARYVTEWREVES